MKSRLAVASAITLTMGGLAFAPSAISQSLYFSAFGGVSSFDAPKSQNDADLVSVTQAILAPPSNTPVNVDSSLGNGTAWGVQIGYNFNRWVAVEVGYANLGTAIYDADVYDASFSPREFLFNTELKHSSSGPTLAVLGMFPINGQFGIHGRAGIFFSDTRHSAHIDNERVVDVKGSDKDIVLGLGGSWHFSDEYALRLEYQRFLDVGDDEETGEMDVDLIAVSFLFK